MMTKRESLEFVRRMADRARTGLNFPVDATGIDQQLQLDRLAAAIERNWSDAGQGPSAQRPLDIIRAVEFLNQLLAMDVHAVCTLFSIRVSCNKQVIDHPTVQVTEDGQLGLLGLLNGLASRHGEFIAAEYDDDDDRYVHIRRFAVIPARDVQEVSSV